MIGGITGAGGSACLFPRRGREGAPCFRDTLISTRVLKALKVLKLFNIPHDVCGGFAVQERRYPRFTVDVDIIVPDVAFAMQKLSMNGFQPNPGSKMTVTDRETKVEVDLGSYRRTICRETSASTRKSGKNITRFGTGFMGRSRRNLIGRANLFQ